MEGGLWKHPGHLDFFGVGETADDNDNDGEAHAQAWQIVRSRNPLRLRHSGDQATPALPFCPGCFNAIKWQRQAAATLQSLADYHVTLKILLK